MTKTIILFFSLLLLFINNTQAESQAMAQTKSQLKQIENQMSQLQLNIDHTHDKQSVLTREIAATDKQIHEGAVLLSKTREAMKNKQNQITALEQKIKTISEQLTGQQRLLTSHIRARYKMGEHQPLQWLLEQDKPDSIGRLLTFYQYLLRSRQHMMSEVIKTRETLILNQNQRHQELMAQASLQQELNKRQKTFDHDKLYRTALIGKLTKDIQNQQQTLQTYQHNKENLSKLLLSLAHRNILQTGRLFTQMRKKLHKPVNTNSGGIRKISQGVVFFSDEGSPVVSVASGRIVFADELNGYGLLLIVDHGRGFMTLYANNQSLFKHKGELVNQGEKIASVGHSGTMKENGLYFEIRQRGKAVNPLEWMS